MNMMNPSFYCVCLHSLKMGFDAEGQAVLADILVTLSEMQTSFQNSFEDIKAGLGRVSSILSTQHVPVSSTKSTFDSYDHFVGEESVINEETNEDIQKCSMVVSHDRLASTDGKVEEKQGSVFQESSNPEWLLQSSVSVGPKSISFFNQAWSSKFGSGHSTYNVIDFTGIQNVSVLGTDQHMTAQLATITSVFSEEVNATLLFEETALITLRKLQHCTGNLGFSSCSATNAIIVRGFQHSNEYAAAIQSITSQDIHFPWEPGSITWQQIKEHALEPSKCLHFIPSDGLGKISWGVFKAKLHLQTPESRLTVEAPSYYAMSESSDVSFCVYDDKLHVVESQTADADLEVNFLSGISQAENTFSITSFRTEYLSQLTHGKEEVSIQFVRKVTLLILEGVWSDTVFRNEFQLDEETVNQSNAYNTDTNLAADMSFCVLIMPEGGPPPDMGFDLMRNPISTTKVIFQFQFSLEVAHGMFSSPFLSHTGVFIKVGLFLDIWPPYFVSQQLLFQCQSSMSEVIDGFALDSLIALVNQDEIIQCPVEPGLHCIAGYKNIQAPHVVALQSANSSVYDVYSVSLGDVYYSAYAIQNFVHYVVLIQNEETATVRACDQDTKSTSMGKKNIDCVEVIMGQNCHSIQANCTRPGSSHQRAVLDIRCFDFGISRFPSFSMHEFSRNMSDCIGESYQTLSWDVRYGVVQPASSHAMAQTHLGMGQNVGCSSGYALNVILEDRNEALSRFTSKEFQNAAERYILGYLLLNKMMCYWSVMLLLDSSKSWPKQIGITYVGDSFVHECICEHLESIVLHFKASFLNIKGKFRGNINFIFAGAVMVSHSVQSTHHVLHRVLFLSAIGLSRSSAGQGTCRSRFLVHVVEDKWHYKLVPIVLMATMVSALSHLMTDLAVGSDHCDEYQLMQVFSAHYCQYWELNHIWDYASIIVWVSKESACATHCVDVVVFESCMANVFCPSIVCVCGNVGGFAVAFASDSWVFYADSVADCLGNQNETSYIMQLYVCLSTMLIIFLSHFQTRHCYSGQIGHSHRHASSQYR